MSYWRDLAGCDGNLVGVLEIVKRIFNNPAKIIPSVLRRKSFYDNFRLIKTSTFKDWFTW